ncbi:hypothetical protein [Pseudoxanthomonas sp. 10H]|uniref:hypothetical protein n=1 Tax=Pseudoxanthomonas sp. 10H TaxID=3242729 RepID=UPI0035573964
MQPHALELALRTHSGHFLCERIHAGGGTREVPFHHEVAPPVPPGLPPVAGRVDEFYRHFGSVTLYHDAASGDAGRFIAPVAAWPALREGFGAWIAALGDDEDGLRPAWLGSALVVGEVPGSGNYILVATEGDRAGHVFEFDHDGFEFRARAPDLFAYVAAWLRPDDAMLVDMASHMRFAGDDPAVQWWIRELHDGDGLRASTSAG